MTNNGDCQSRQVIRQLARHNPGTRTLVTGCYATRDPAALRKLPGVFEVVADKRELPDILQRHGICDLPAGISRFEGRKRAYVKVQDGCILKCSYCIIPHVRPRLESRSPAEIEAEVRRLVGQRLSGNRADRNSRRAFRRGHHPRQIRNRRRSGCGISSRQLDRIPGRGACGFPALKPRK